MQFGELLFEALEVLAHLRQAVHVGVHALVLIERLHGEVARLKEQAERLDRLAHQDSLIDLPNRRGFMRQLDMLIGRVSRYGESAAMLFVDIDGLKAINDGFGSRASRRLLSAPVRF